MYDRESCYVEFDRNAMLQADSSIRMENRPLIDPKIGVVRFMPVNLAPLTPDYVASYMANQKAMSY